MKNVHKFQAMQKGATYEKGSSLFWWVNAKYYEHEPGRSVKAKPLSSSPPWQGLPFHANGAYV
jgi:hypothetical protein